MRDVSELPRPLKTVRSRVTNGSSLHSGGVDGRTAPAKRFRDIVCEITSDLGGADRLSEGQRQLVRRAAMLSVQCESMEAAAVSGGKIDLEAFGQLTDRIGRAFGRLGLKRVAKIIQDPLHDHFSRPPERPAA